ncbi:MAG: tRNA (adenosine(37)-N6)-threonylcarbamoyltransferase complex dimerization subunit type 1 TsaB [Candidatus Saccharimonas sp.]|nr:tRNA (adenosine(37)-N6)-threonylcarbamoyltransferase complex dimerization subunit type 1 TsaB [Planctomycetaceae bacterium]
MLCDGELLGERSLGEAGRRHAQSLVLELHELLQSHGAKPRDVKAVAVSKGPGSFTGLRVGLVCAKTFAYATGCQFVAVDTFEAIADNCPIQVRDVWIIENAQRGDFFVGRYVRDETDSWRPTGPIQTVAAEEWLAARSADETITGPGLPYGDLQAVRARLLTDDAVARPRASAIARLGQHRLLARDACSPSDDFDFWKAVPFYIRPSAAEEKRAKQGETSTTPSS